MTIQTYSWFSIINLSGSEFVVCVSILGTAELPLSEFGVAALKPVQASEELVLTAVISKTQQLLYHQFLEIG